MVSLFAILKENGGSTVRGLEPHRQNILPLVTQRLPAILLLSSEAFLREEYLKKGLSAAQIAKEVASSKTAVFNALRRLKIPIREAHKHHGRASQPRYGKKKVRGKLNPHHREEQVIGIIEDLRREGLSLRKIAEVLTKMKIPTKCRGRKWHPQMIQRVLGARCCSNKY